MLGFGYLTSIISRKATHKILKASGVIVIILGAIMINRGLALTGTGYDLNSLTSSSFGVEDNINEEGIILKNGFQEIRMEVDRYGWSPDKFILKKDVPVKWIINAKELNGCNNAIQVPKLGLKFDLKQGEQIIEFTPIESGNLPFSCWMGMIPGIFVVEDNPNVEQQNLDDIALPSAGSCGSGSSGGCGCGGA